MATPVDVRYVIPAPRGVKAGTFAGGQLGGSVAADDIVAAGSFGLPAWVPATAWQWADVPGTRWSDYIKDDGTSLAPKVTALDPGVEKSYSAVWSYSGPIYSRSTHEFWMFGGGHAGTTINILTRTVMDSIPSVVMACAPTTEALRRDRALTNYATYLANGPYFGDGKPYSPHSYFNNQFIPAIDTFLSFGLQFIASSSNGSDMGGGAQGYRAIPAFQRSASNWSAPGSFTDIPAGGDELSGPRVLSADDTSIYWWHTSAGLRKFNAVTNTHSSIGGTASRPWETQGGVACNNSADVSLHIRRDSDAGIQLKTCDLTTGVQTTVTVSGDSIPTGLLAYGVVYAPELDRYYSLWINSAALNNRSGTASTVLLVELQLTSSTTATATLKPTNGATPTKFGSVTGMGYDHGCVLLMSDATALVKVLKVS